MSTESFVVSNIKKHKYYHIGPYFITEPESGGYLIGDENMAGISVTDSFYPLGYRYSNAPENAIIKNNSSSGMYHNVTRYGVASLSSLKLDAEIYHDNTPSITDKLTSQIDLLLNNKVLTWPLSASADTDYISLFSTNNQMEIKFDTETKKYNYRTRDNHTTSEMTLNKNLITNIEDPNYLKILPVDVDSSELESITPIYQTSATYPLFKYYLMIFCYEVNITNKQTQETSKTYLFEKKLPSTSPNYIFNYETNVGKAQSEDINIQNILSNYYNNFSQSNFSTGWHSFNPGTWPNSNYFIGFDTSWQLSKTQNYIIQVNIYPIIIITHTQTFSYLRLYPKNQLLSLGDLFICESDMGAISKPYWFGIQNNLTLEDYIQGCLNEDDFIIPESGKFYWSSPNFIYKNPQSGQLEKIPTNSPQVIYFSQSDIDLIFNQ